MHYANGREAKLGDRVIGTNYGGIITGIVVDQHASSDTCNLSIVPITNAQSVTAKEFLHVEDALMAGLPRPQI